MTTSNICPQPAPAAGAREALRQFRKGLYSCLAGWADAGFEVCEALLCAPGPVSCLPGLSLVPVFRRGHGSLYSALSRTRIDPARMRALLVAAAPAGWPDVFAVDASAWPRNNAETSPQRGYYHSPSQHSAGQPIVAGWNFSWIAQLNWEPDSWTAPVDVTRIPPHADTGTATATQIRALAADLAGRPDAVNSPTPLFVFDAGYNPAALTYDLSGTPVNLTVRLRNDRVFYADPPPPVPGHGPGRPRRHGARFECAHPDTWPAPAHHSTGHDHCYGDIDIQAWPGLHPRISACRGRFAGHKQAPTVRATIIRVQVDHLPKPTSRATTTLWLWAAGPDPDPDQCAHAYLHRFDLEHTFRFLKGTLGWTLPRLQTPEQADTWTWIVTAAYAQLLLAKPLVADQRLPWEKPLPRHRLCSPPTRVRRGFPATAASLGTPAQPPKPKPPAPDDPKAPAPAHDPDTPPSNRRPPDPIPGLNAS